jgi:CRP-like cAMP-binding protein
MNKLASELDAKRCFDAFKILREDTNLFTTWSEKDLTKLSEYAKVFSFHKNDTIIDKGESVDYLGIILNGNLLTFKGDVGGNTVVNELLSPLRSPTKTINSEAPVTDRPSEKPIAILTAGDLVGYMGVMGLPGTRMHQFTIKARDDGFIAIVRLDDFKAIDKNDPHLGYKILELAGRRAYNLVSLQYYGEEAYAPIKLHGAFRKVKESIESCRELDPFFNLLEGRDRKNLLMKLQYVELHGNREQQITKLGDTCNSIIFITRGEFNSFKNNKPYLCYTPGTILGKKEFLFKLGWEESIVGTKGTIVKLERDYFEDLQVANPKSANAFLRALISALCIETREKFEDKKLKHDFLKNYYPDMMNEPQSGIKKPVDSTSANVDSMFIELDTTKRTAVQDEKDTNNLLSTLGGSTTFKDFMNKKTAQPLILHDIFKGLVETKAKQLASTTKKLAVPDNGTESIFLANKLRRQMEANQGKRKKVTKTPSNAAALKSARTEDHGMDYDFESLKNDYEILENKKVELEDIVQRLKAENSRLQGDMRKMHDLNDVAGVKINKSMLHKELLSKDLLNQDNAIGLLNKNYSKKFASFGDVLHDQYTISKKAQKVAKYAYRWLNTVRERRRLAKVMASSKY